MASITFLDGSSSSKSRIKVTYDVRDVSGIRKRKSHTFPPGTPKREIYAFKRKVESEYENSEGIDYSKEAITIDEFLGEYFETYSAQLAKSTLYSYKQMAYGKNGISKSLGSVRLKKLNTIMIQRYANSLLEEKKLSIKTVKNHINFLNVVIERAIDLKYVTQPYNVVSKVILPPCRQKQVESYTVEEVQKLLNLVNEDASEELRLAVHIAVYTGMRKSEISGLKYSNIDWDKKLIKVREAKVTTKGEDVVKETKSQAGERDIPLCPSLEKELRQAQRKYRQNRLSCGEKFVDSGYVICASDGVPLRSHVISNRYRRFMERHSNEIRRLPFHSLRHSFASIAVAQGADLKSIQTIMGHSSINVTMNIYCQAYWDSQQACVEKLDAIISPQTKEA